MRSLSFPKLLVGQDWDDAMPTSPNTSQSSHSRESSGCSSSENYSPVTPTFSLREHARVHSSSSCSSLAITPPKFEFEHPESPLSAAKTTLDDLVEVPDELEDRYDLCDDIDESIFHGRSSGVSASSALPANGLQENLTYDLADGFCSDGDIALHGANRRRAGSGDSPVSLFASRFSSRLPSLARRPTKDRSIPTTPTGRQGARSAPPSRVPSFRLPSLAKSHTSQLEKMEATTSPPQSSLNLDLDLDLNEATPPASTPLGITMVPIKDPIDRQALASTPLLPPTMRLDFSDDESVQSPLQSPSTADSLAAYPFVTSPGSTPVHSCLPTPPLSSKPSFASFGMARSPQIPPVADIPAISIGQPGDRWASLLGHANFDIVPQPYMPETCNVSTCKQLVADWGSARTQYMTHVQHISDNYGVTSQQYKLTEQKWAQIDAKWKRNHEVAVTGAKKNGAEEDVKSPVFQPLAEPAPLAKMPSLDDGKGKFPTLNDDKIVGPMVQYAKISRRPSKRSTLVNFLSGLRVGTTTARPRR